MIKEIRPIITETTIDLAKRHWYTFAVPLNWSKNKCKKIIGGLFNIDVLQAKALIIKGKTKRSLKTRRMHQLSSWKKVMVKVKEGQKIDWFEVGA